MVQEVGNASTDIKRGISGSTLKWIALVTMLIDHIGAVVVVRQMFANAAAQGMVGVVAADGLYYFYLVLRSIGRIAFPVYCFLLVEGFIWTRHKARYALRLGAFAFLSEVPFDLAFTSKLLEFSYQNVFFTLCIGLVTMMVAETCGRRVEETFKGRDGRIQFILRYFVELMIGVAGAFLAEWIHTDYGAKGVLCIMVLYFFRRNKKLQMVAGCISFVWDSVAPLAFIPIAAYNGSRGRQLKYVFYLFYPIHLLLLYLICVGLGINGYPAV